MKQKVSKFERKKPYLIMLKPTLKTDAEKKAGKKKLTLSEIMEILLYDYLDS